MEDPKAPDESGILKRIVGLMGRQPVVEPPEEAAMPVLIGNYRVERLLGRGGMGEVYLARDERLGRPVAIKKIRSDKASNDQDRVRLRREARVVVRLEHPAIAQVHDVVETEDGDCVVMQYVEGRTLSDLMVAGGIDGPLALRVAREIAEGLAAAHAEGLVHRDLKAENVVVTPLGQAKILDFGLVKEIDASNLDLETAKGLVLGTVSTMSPEQATGKKVDARSDLFSFGVLLFELFTGCSPFWRKRWVDSLQAIRRAQPPPARSLRPEIPEALSNLIERLLRKSPDDRPQGAREVAEALMRIASSGSASELARPGVEQVVEERYSSSKIQVNRLPLPSARPPGEEAGRTASKAPAWLAFLRRLSPQRWAGALAVILLALTGVMFFLQGNEHVRVLVIEPELSPGNVAEDVILADNNSLADVVLVSLLASLADFARLHPLSPSAASDSAPHGDELLRSTLTCQKGPCRITLERLRLDRPQSGVQVETLIRKSTFEVPATSAFAAAEVIDQHVETLFSSFERRRAMPVVRTVDFSTFTKVRSRLARGEEPAMIDLVNTLNVTDSSPLFVEGYLLVFEVALHLEDLQAASDILERLTQVDAKNPRLQEALFDLALIRGELDRAAEVIDVHAALAPTDPEVWRRQVELAARRGNLDEAVRLGRQLADSKPTPALLRQLAGYEIELGRFEDAAEHLRRLLVLAPGDDEAHTLLRQLSEAAED